jgi:hypothetical protein
MPLFLRRGGWHRDGREADNHERQSQPAQHDSSDSEWNLVVGRRRVTRSGEKQQGHDHDVREFTANDHVGDRGGQQQERDAMRPASDERVQNVPAVELADRNQVERRDENPNPAGKQPRVQNDVVVRGNWAEEKSSKPFQQQRVAVLRTTRSRIDQFDMRL